MKGIVLASHGLLADGLYDTLKIFCGEPEQIQTLCLMPGDDMSEFLNQLRNTIDEVDTGEGVVVFCDLLFGTPCNCSGALLGKEEFEKRVQVITGMNLSMVLEYVGSRGVGMEVDQIVETGHAGIVDFNKLYKERSQK